MVFMIKYRKSLIGIKSSSFSEKFWKELKRDII